MTQDVDTDAIEEARKARKREYARAWYVANTEKQKETTRAWRAANPEKRRTAARARYVANAEKQREAARAWYSTSLASNPILYKRMRMLLAAKTRAKSKNITFDITIDDIQAPITCPVLGIELGWSNKKTEQNSPSLDRIIPELGYVRGNVMVISYRANALKSNAMPHELRLVADFYAALDVNSNDTQR